MKVLGISGSERHAAAAVAVDGSIVAAAEEQSFARVPLIGYRHTGGLPLAAIDACLTRAHLSLTEIDRIIVVDDERHAHGGVPETPAERGGLFGPGGPGGHDTLDRELRTRQLDSVAPALADARQLAAVCDDENLLVLVLALDDVPPAVFERRGSAFALLQTHAADQLSCAITRMARALGLGPSGRYDAIERLASLGAPGDAAVFDKAIGWNPDRGVTVSDDEFAKAIERLDGGALSPDWSLDVRRQHDRQALASAFCARVGALVVEMARSLLERPGARRIGLAGGRFSSRGIVAAVASALGDAVIIAPVPEAPGRALGAALESLQAGALLQTLALGPEFTEQEIKLALENCRLDYLYEPDWSRLMTRVSNMLSRGTVVAWFQGPMGFGPRSIGTRGILCDPSNKYARENVNCFLLHGSPDDALPVSMTAADMEECLEQPVSSPFLALDAKVKAPWRDKLRAAIDHRQSIPTQRVTEAQSPAFFGLLQLHRKRSSVPGLINVPLSGANEPAACTPRDAIRTTFSSAIDALVIGRFLLMKDYWLLRSGADL
jgi:carbamoyltransferase